MTDLPDGIYDVPEFGLVAVKGNRYGMSILHRRDPEWVQVHALPANTSAWTRVADLPDLRMAEPDQIGYPVMAACDADDTEHLHIGLPKSGGLPWVCDENACLWDVLTDPRDLTADEIVEHNLWTGERSSQEKTND